MNRLSFMTLCTALLALAGCSKSKTSSIVYHMGDRVQVGALIYTVLETDWKGQLGDPGSGRVPKNRFVLVRLAVTNSGGRTASVPSLMLEDAKGRVYPEESNGEGVDDWLGILRHLDPAQTEDGRVLFDVPPGDYKLRVGEDAELTETEEKYALVALPLTLDPGVQAPAPPPGK